MSRLNTHLLFIFILNHFEVVIFAVFILTHKISHIRDVDLTLKALNFLMIIMETKGFFQFEIIINGLVSSF